MIKCGSALTVVCGAFIVAVRGPLLEKLDEYRTYGAVASTFVAGPASAEMLLDAGVWSVKTDKP